MNKSEHSPSRHRTIIKASKSGKRPFEALVSDAAAIQDPYYSSLTLFMLAMDSRASDEMASKFVAQSLQLAEEVERPWQKAELLEKMIKKAHKLSGTLAAESRKSIFEIISQFPIGKGLADAIDGCAKYFEPYQQIKLLKIAITNQGFEQDSAKPVLKYLIKNGKENQIQPALEILGEINNPELKTKLLGYLHNQISKSGIDNSTALEKALEASITIELASRFETIKYLIKQSSNVAEMETIAEHLTKLTSPIEKSQLFIALAAGADKAGREDIAMGWFENANELACNIDNGDERARILLNLGIGLEKMGGNEKAAEHYYAALEIAGDEKLRNKIKKAMGQHSTAPFKSFQSRPPIHETKNRHVFGLYDTYEGGIKPIHLRMAARAAPLCIAYNLDLALMGFPTDDLESFIDSVQKETNIGKGGFYLRELADTGRVRLIKCSKTQPPSDKDWQSLGLPIATTSNPSKSKAVKLAKARALAEKNHRKKRLCLIMGLGRQGLPRSLLDAVPHHVEITGKNIALETSTAMGIMAQMLGQLE